MSSTEPLPLGVRIVSVLRQFVDVTREVPGTIVRALEDLGNTPEERLRAEMLDEAKHLCAVLGLDSEMAPEVVQVQSISWADMDGAARAIVEAQAASRTVGELKSVLEEASTPLDPMDVVRAWMTEADPGT